MLLVVGLGNPGKGYASHRHNVGFMVADEIARRARADAFREKFSAEYARADLGDEQVILLKPQTYMNESGRSVQPAMAFFKVEPKSVIVIHDELDVPFGEVRLKFGGGHAGHNGLRSIMEVTGSGDFGRVRVGIGRPLAEFEPGRRPERDFASFVHDAPKGGGREFRGDVASWVLSSFGTDERAKLPDLIKRAADAVNDIAKRGFAAAMNARNTRPRPPKPPKPLAEQKEEPKPPAEGTPKTPAD